MAHLHADWRVGMLSGSPFKAGTADHDTMAPHLRALGLRRRFAAMSSRTWLQRGSTLNLVKQNQCVAN